MRTGQEPVAEGASRSGSDFYLDRARDSLQLADREPLLTRRQMHLRAAERWIQFAERAKRSEARTAARRPDNESSRS